MLGHTDKATINQRRPLSSGMVFVLRCLAKSRVWRPAMTAARKNQLRALMDRGYAAPAQGSYQNFEITDAGRKALDALG